MLFEKPPQTFTNHLGVDGVISGNRNTKTRQKFYETTPKLFGELLQRRLVIPMNQRPFEWEETNVLEYLDDIWSTFLNGKCDFSGGTIITYKEGDTHEIYDGQQRIISKVIFIHMVLSKILYLQ